MSVKPTMVITLPTGRARRASNSRELAPRLETLEGKTVAQLGDRALHRWKYVVIGLRLDARPVVTTLSAGLH